MDETTDQNGNAILRKREFCRKGNFRDKKKSIKMEYCGKWTGKFRTKANSEET